MVSLNQKHDSLNTCFCPHNMPICMSMCNICVTGICTVQDLVTDNKNMRHSQQFTGQPIHFHLNVYIQEHPRKPLKH